MALKGFVSPDEIRTRFSRAMSGMYRSEVPQYGTLLQLVAEVNAEALSADPRMAAQLARNGELDRIDIERHGAIRLGTAEELATMRRLFAVMGMQPVGYYDLSLASVPVHSTAFRPVTDEALARNPFRVFTSLLRLELVEDPALREEARAILARRRIFTDDVLDLIDRSEREGGLTDDAAEVFVHEALETFRWHRVATVDAETYVRLSRAHRLVADVVCFRGPHINHLTPRTLDIDRVQAGMPGRGIVPKTVIEGPPSRSCPILLRQTSFRALDERILFLGADGAEVGTHTARFGEIEQRGIALTRSGRASYDRLLASAREEGAAGSSTGDYGARLQTAFHGFPDDYEEIRRKGLGFFRYALNGAVPPSLASASVEELIDSGYVTADPIVYEDFLPVSAAGIFQSNLGGHEQRSYTEHASRDAFVEALGAPVLDEFALYEEAEARSLAAVRKGLPETSGSPDEGALVRRGTRACRSQAGPGDRVIEVAPDMPRSEPRRR